MKDKFQKLEERRGDFSHKELHDIVVELVDEIINTDSRLISVSKSWQGYGIWLSVGFANEYRFGEKLAELITKALTGFVTYDEDMDFMISDFRERLEDKIFDYLF